MKLRDLIQSEQTDAAEAALLRAQLEASKEKDPILLKLLTGVSAWIASIFLLGFVIVPFQPDIKFLTFIGAVLASLAILSHHKAKNAGTFIQQTTLSCMMCGHLLILVGILDFANYNDELLTLSITQTALCALPIWLFRRAPYQVSALLLAACFWTIYAVELNSPWLFRLLLATELATLAAITLWQARSLSFAYALALAAGATIFFLDWVQSFSWHGHFSDSLWPTNLIVAGFVATTGWYFTSATDRKRPKILILFLILLALAFLSSPGLLYSIGLLILGYGLRDTIFAGLGLISLPTFLIYFYYSLQVSLLEKSGILLASGLLCLLTAYLAQSARKVTGTSETEAAT